MPATNQTNSTDLPTNTRIYSLDLLRGVVMIIMALDHTRDFLHFDAFLHDPVDVTTTSVPLFFTRWITHFCAPVFVFLAGTSIYLQSLRKAKGELAKFLLQRGLWLIFVELVIMTLAFTFDLSYALFFLQVIWAIGISMVIMALMIRLPYWVILVTGAAILLGHNIFDGVQSTQHGFLWDLLRNGNFAMHTLWEGHQLVIIYPFVPWLGLMMLGFCAGRIYEPATDPTLRRKMLARAGTGLILFFVVLRFSNVYGDPFPWSAQKNAVFTFLSFLNVNKYPPSLLYLCITIGPALLFLSYFENSSGRFVRAISVFGRVPFFFYVIHFYILHSLTTILFLFRGHSLDEPPTIPFKFVVPGEGFSLPGLYFVWILLVLALYPMCKWFSDYKKRSNKVWLSYL